jgi:hypothetical protein
MNLSLQPKLTTLYFKTASHNPVLIFRGYLVVMKSGLVHALIDFFGTYGMSNDRNDGRLTGRKDEVNAYTLVQLELFGKGREES